MLVSCFCIIIKIIRKTQADSNPRMLIKINYVTNEILLTLPLDSKINIKHITIKLLFAVPYIKLYCILEWNTLYLQLAHFIEFVKYVWNIVRRIGLNQRKNTQFWFWKI